MAVLTERVPPAEGAVPSPSARPGGSVHIKGLDTLRIVLALWVVISHITPPWPIESRLVKAALGQLFTGHAAVLVFFVISGFCIHLPYSRGRRLDLKSYFVRREVRILVPLIAAFAFGGLLHNFGFMMVLWSLFCEEIYYTVYPLFLRVRRRSESWRPVLSIATVVAIAVLFLTSHRGLPPDSGYGLTPVFLFPAWLLGCVLAEEVERIPEWRAGRLGIWSLRMFVWAVTIVLSLVRFHSSFSETYLLLPFCFLAYVWLRCEVAWFRVKPPHAFLERLGGASYTVYLTHMLAPAIAVSLGLATFFRTPHGAHIEGSFPGWVAVFGIMALFSAGFYLLVEKPAHRLAKAVGNRLAPAKAKA